jgi:phosphoglucosamine mutase
VRNKPKLMSLPLVVQAVKESEVELAGDGRVVLRYSGTENLCRVMVEAPTDDVVQRLVNRIVVAVKQSLGA